MVIVVCIKAVPDPRESSKVKIDPNTKTLTRANVSLVMNQVDKNALEAAIVLKEKMGAHVIALSMGPPAASEILKESLARGADRAILLTDKVFGGADAYVTSYTLSKGIGKIGKCDLVICGNESSDGSTAQVGPELSVFLDYPTATAVKEIVDFSGDIWKLKAHFEYGSRLIEIKLPALITVTRHLNQPRNISFSGIVKSRKKQIIEWGAQDLDISEEHVGSKGSPTVLSELRTSKNKRVAQMITGEREEVANSLLQRLAEEGVL